MYSVHSEMEGSIRPNVILHDLKTDDRKPLADWNLFPAGDMNQIFRFTPDVPTQNSCLQNCVTRLCCRQQYAYISYS